MRGVNRRVWPHSATNSHSLSSKMPRPKKSLGQHFLVEPGLARKIVARAGFRPEDLVLEIGPGRGALTELLLGEVTQVIAVEIDSRLIQQLVDGLLLRRISTFTNDRVAYGGGNLLLIEADILRVRLADWEDHWPHSLKLRVIGNLPYNQATAILQALFDQRQQIEDMTFMLQREVADRLLAQPGHREYGYLSVIGQFYCHIERLFHVSPGAFHPQPRVHSTMVRLRPISPDRLTADGSEQFQRLVSACFRAKRKTLLNNLRRLLAERSTEWITHACRAVGIDAQRRAETLTVEEFIALSDRLTTGVDEGSTFGASLPSTRP